MTGGTYDASRDEIVCAFDCDCEDDGGGDHRETTQACLTATGGDGYLEHGLCDGRREDEISDTTRIAAPANVADIKNNPGALKTFRAFSALDLGSLCMTAMDEAGQTPGDKTLQCCDRPGGDDDGGAGVDDTDMTPYPTSPRMP